MTAPETADPPSQTMEMASENGDSCAEEQAMSSEVMPTTETEDFGEQKLQSTEGNAVNLLDEVKGSQIPMAAPESEISSPQVMEKNPGTPNQQIKKTSWANVVNNNQSHSKYDLTIHDIDGTLTVEVPDDIIESSVPLWEDFLIGKFLETAPHVGKVHVIVNKIWTAVDKSVRIDAFPVNETTVKFRIKDKATRNRILRRGMWNIAGIPMIVSKWSPIVEEAPPEIESIPLWVILKNVPHKMFSEPGLRYIASAVGIPKRLHPDTLQCKSFDEAKVFVEADLTKELPDSFHFKSKLGVDAVVDFSYPWLPLKCQACNKWGHLTDVCLVKITQRGKTKGDSSAVETNIVIDKPVQHAIQSKTVSTEAAEQNPEDTAEGTEAVVEQNSVVIVEEQEICVDSCVVVNTTTPVPVVEHNICVVDTTSTPTKDSTSASAQLDSVPAQVTEPTQVNLAVPADSSAPQRKVEKITRASVLAMIIPKRNVTSAIPIEPTICRTSSNASLRNNKFAYLDSSEDESEDDESEEEGEDPPPSAPDMEFFSPSGKRFLRERPVPQTIKAKEMQYVARGRGNRGRGKRGGRC